MIKNQRQYRLTQAAIASFEAAIASWDPASFPTDVHPEMRDLQLAGMKSQLETLIQEQAEYEALVNGQVVHIPLNSLADLPRALIKARIARGMTQRQLAEAMGIKQQQVQRWEYEDYEGVSFSNLLSVAQTLQVSICECINLPALPTRRRSSMSPKDVQRTPSRSRQKPTSA